MTVLASRDSWLSSITLHLICPALHFLQIIISSFTLTKMLNKANATAHVDVCIPLVSTFCLVTLYLINCYLIMYHQSAPELHYPLFLPILFDLYLLLNKCRINPVVMKFWIALVSTYCHVLPHRITCCSIGCI